FLRPIIFLFFQAEDGIRYRNVTGVQTCALPILHIGHYQRSKYTVFLCSLTNILQSKLIILSSVPFTFYGIHTAVVSVFIITKKEIGRASCREKVECKRTGRE